MTATDVSSKTVIDNNDRTTATDAGITSTSNGSKDEQEKEKSRTHQQLANEYRKREAKQVSELISLCAKGMIPMADNFVEQGNLHD